MHSTQAEYLYYYFPHFNKPNNVKARPIDRLHQLESL